ncbi:MAG TPA: hypothetical protein VIM30_02265 [Candidatus Limnocylindrales bacterium]|jgi:hypothetical protein
MDDAWQGSLYELTLEQARGSAVAGSQATVRRSGDTVDFEIRTSGLTPGNAYTVWLMAFNNPNACKGDGAPNAFRCGPGDMGNPEAGFTLMFGGTGGVADSDTMEFRGQHAQGDGAGVELGTPGLLDAAAAEVHLRVRDHGPAQPGLEEDQVATLMGGCTDDSPPGAGSGRHGTYPCRDVQATGM